MDVRQEIENLIEERIRPFLQADGGDVALVDYDPESREVQITLQGACVGCPSSRITLQMGIERTLVEAFPGAVERVVPV